MNMSRVLENTYTSKLSEQFFLKEEFVDVHFTFRDVKEVQQVPAHKMILSIQSPVFERMFFGALMEKGDVEIVDATIDEFTGFLQFFYLNNVTLTIENIEAVVRLADKYDVLGRVSACAALLEQELTPKDLCWGYQLAIHLDNTSLIKFCEQQISANPKKVFATDSFKCCSKTVLERILNLPMPIEEIDLFKAALEWAKQACIKDDLDENNGSNLRSQIGDCLKLFRFNEMKVQDITALHSSHIGLFTLTELEDIMLLLTVKGYEPKIFNQSPRPDCKYVWNTTDALECKRTVLYTSEYKIKSEEFVRFSSNHMLWLGAICIQSLSKTQANCNCSLRYPTLNAITITEINAQNSVISKVIYEQFETWSCGLKAFQLLSPIKIKPQNLYEIRLRVSKIGHSRYESINSFWKPVVELNGDTTILFHPSSSSGYDAMTSGLISGFKFNRL